MVTPDVVRRFLSGVGMGGRPARPEVEDDDALLRRFLASQGRLSDMPATAEDTAEVQRALAAQQLRPEVDAGASALALPRPSSRTGAESPAAAAPTVEDEEYNARRATASRAAFANDLLSGVTEGFDRATNLVSGVNQPIRARDSRSVAEAERRFAASEEERAARAKALRDAPRIAAMQAAELAKLEADTQKSQAQAASTVADTAYETALRDVNSPETQAMREQAVAMSGGKITPEMARSLNGLQLRDSLKTATSQLNAEALAQFRSGQLEAQTASAEADRKLRGWALKQGWDITQLTLAQQAELAKKKQEFDAEQAELDRQNRLAMAALTAERQERALNARNASKLSERGVGGFRIKEGAFPSQDNEKQMSSIAIDSRRIQYSLDRLDELYKQHGTELFGKYAGEMESEFMAITNLLRGINNMGVPNGRDYEMLAKELQDPTTWKDMFTSRGRNIPKLASLKQRLRQAVSISADVYGYEPDDGSTPPPTDANGVTPIDSLGARAPTLPTRTPVTEPPSQAAQSRPATSQPERPMRPAPVVGDIPRLVSTKGMKAGDLAKSMEVGETVRIAWKNDDGTPGFRTVLKKPDGKLKIISQE